MRIVELIVILIAAGLFPGATMSLRVFCEQCGVWRRTHKSRVRLGVPDDRQLLERIDEGDLARLDELPAGRGDSELMLEIDQLTCADEGHAPVVAVQKVTTESGRKKRKKRKMLWWYSFVDAAWLHELVQRAGVSSKE